MSALPALLSKATKSAPEIGRIAGLSGLGKGVLGGMAAAGAGGAAYANRDAIADKMKGTNLLTDPMGTGPDGDYNYSRRRFALDNASPLAGAIAGGYGANALYSKAMQLLKRYPDRGAAGLATYAGALGGGVLANKYLGDKYSPQTLAAIFDENADVGSKSLGKQLAGAGLGGVGGVLAGAGIGALLGRLMKTRFNPKYEERLGPLVRSIASALPTLGGAGGGLVGTIAGVRSAQYGDLKKTREARASKMQKEEKVAATVDIEKIAFMGGMGGISKFLVSPAGGKVGRYAGKALGQWRPLNPYAGKALGQWRSLNPVLQKGILGGAGGAGVGAAATDEDGNTLGNMLRGGLIGAGTLAAAQKYILKYGMPSWAQKMNPSTKGISPAASGAAKAAPAAEQAVAKAVPKATPFTDTSRYASYGNKQTLPEMLGEFTTA